MLSAIRAIALVPVHETSSRLALPPRLVDVQDTVIDCPGVKVPLNGAVTEMLGAAPTLKHVPYATGVPVPVR